jgi:hypothetical protein
MSTKKVKCNLCDFVWVFENTPEKNKENNQFSCDHMNAHKPTEVPLIWIDLEPPPPILEPVSEP